MINLFFDVDDTLYDQLDPFARAFYEVFGNAAVPCEEVFKYSRQYSDEVFEETEAGRMSKEDMFVYRITRALADWGVFPEREEALAFQQVYAGYQMEITLIPEMRTILEWSCKNAGITGIITNGPAGHQKNKIKRLGLDQWISKDNIFISGELGLAKPDARLFHLVRQKLGIIPCDTYYIGDSFQNDVAGPKAAGWRAVWLNRRCHKMPDSQEAVPDYVASNYEELWNIIRKIDMISMR